MDEQLNGHYADCLSELTEMRKLNKELETQLSTLQEQFAALARLFAQRPSPEASKPKEQPKLKVFGGNHGTRT